MAFTLDLHTIFIEKKSPDYFLNPVQYWTRVFIHKYTPGLLAAYWTLILTFSQSINKIDNKIHHCYVYGDLMDFILLFISFVDCENMRPTTLRYKYLCFLTSDKFVFLEDHCCRHFDLKHSKSVTNTLTRTQSKRKECHRLNVSLILWRKPEIMSDNYHYYI